MTRPAWCYSPSWPTKKNCYHPIIYVRGFAATQGEIDETVADPYMGFNIGSTKARTVWTGEVKRFYFESPLVRLMADHDYDDVFVDGDDLLAVEKTDRAVPYRSIVIYRYYDEASQGLRHRRNPPIEIRQRAQRAHPPVARAGLRQSRRTE